MGEICKSIGSEVLKVKYGEAIRTSRARVAAVPDGSSSGIRCKGRDVMVKRTHPVKEPLDLPRLWNGGVRNYGGKLPIERIGYFRGLGESITIESYGLVRWCCGTFAG